MDGVKLTKHPSMFGAQFIRFCEEEWTRQLERKHLSYTHAATRKKMAMQYKY